MANAKYNIPFPVNEPVKTYAPGSKERREIKETLSKLRGKQIEIPLIIGGEEVRTGRLVECRLPHNHGCVVAVYHQAGEREIARAIEAAIAARARWSGMEWYERVSVFLRAAELVSGPWRHILNASNMLGQSKNVFQAEIDSCCELADFLRFNSYYAMQLYEQQPPYSPPPTWNRMDYRPLEGFVFAITPFNFLSIAGNLPTCPALMGNVVLWKPASNAVYPAYYFMRLLKEAGLPDGVINFIPGSGNSIGPVVLSSPYLAGIHFTGSTETFRLIWKAVGNNVSKYKTYPRMVGETGGKDFVFAHRSASVEALNVALVRGAFEYQGQKCSAVSRAYIPRSLWGDLKDHLIDTLKGVRIGDVEDFSNFMNAVIDGSAFSRITNYIEYVRGSGDSEIIFGGDYENSRGYFISPTVAVTSNPHSRTMEEEVFGPLLTIYLYDDDRYEETLHLCESTSPYGLTGAIFSHDREAVAIAERILENAAGNFYINDKPTGAVVGQQPFGGSRLSGTNDKAGSILNMLRWVSPRSIKENFLPPLDYRYPFMLEP